MRRISTVQGIATLAAAALLFAARSEAEQDHLLGFKAKDVSNTTAPSDVTVETPLTVGNCQLKKAKFMLLQAEKDGGDDPRGSAPGNFVCYKAKCADVPATTSFDTQFGTVNMESKKAHILCLPADANICGDNELDGAEQCDGTADSACPGNCLPDCTCSPCTGALVGGFCWFDGGSSESCDTVCANHSLTYDPATEAYAGSGGNDANCAAVLTRFGKSLALTTSCADGYGCSTTGGAGIRCTSPTTATASLYSVSRECACQ